MLLRTALTAVLLFTLTSSLAAQKFHFGPEDETGKTLGNAAGRTIEGVIVAEDETTYTVRIVGGEMIVPKDTVTKVESTGITLANIETAEQEQAEQVADAEIRRQQIQAAEASAQRDYREAVRAAEPAEEKTLLIEVDFQNLLPSYTFQSYDPVLHRANLSGLRAVIEDYLRREVRAAAHQHPYR